jgi:hypothetical protein
MDDAPLALFAPIDLSSAEHPLRGFAALHVVHRAFEADGVREVPADVCGGNVEPVVVARRKERSQPREVLLTPSTPPTPSGATARRG